MEAVAVGVRPAVTVPDTEAEPVPVVDAVTDEEAVQEGVCVLVMVRVNVLVPVVLRVPEGVPVETAEGVDVTVLATVTEPVRVVDGEPDPEPEPVLVGV